MMKSRELFVGGLNVFMWMITADGTVLDVPVADIHIGEFDELRIGGMSTREESFVFLEAAGAGAPALAEAEVDGGVPFQGQRPLRGLCGPMPVPQGLGKALGRLR